MTASTLEILAVQGSLRSGSYNNGLIEALRELAPEGVHVTVWDRLAEIPLYNQDRDGESSPEVVVELRARIREADGLLIACPEYNHGPAGVVKNWVDWASRPPGRSCLVDKPIGIVGASPGRVGTARGQSQLRQNLSPNGALVLPRPEVLVGGAREKFEGGRLVDESTREWLTSYLERFADWIRRLA